MAVDVHFGLWYLLTLNLITCSLELCTSAAFSYLPPMLLEAGFSESGMSIVMAIGPLIALFCVPSMGVMSDRCTSNLGRRKPFIIMLSMVTLLSLIFIPNGNKIAHGITYIIPISEHSAELCTLALSVILLDFSSQACYTPMESLLSDPCKSASQYNRSFAMFSLMMSLGACLGYLITSVNWMDNSFGRYMGDQELAVFSILIIIFVTSMVISIYVAVDPPLKDFKVNGVAVELNDDTTHLILPVTDNISKTNNNDDMVSPINDSNDCTSILTPNKPITRIFQEIFTIYRFFRILFCPFMKLFKIIESCFQNLLRITVLDTYNTMILMPINFKRLWCADLFTCIAVMGFRLYFTDFMGEALYRGNPDADKDTLENRLYEEGIRMGSWGLLLNSLTSMIFSAFLEHLIRLYGTKAMYIFGMGMFTLVTFIIIFLDRIAMVVLLASFTGFGNAVVTTLPYTILTMYHEQPEVFFPDMENHSKLLNRKGADIALLDGAYFLAEVVASFLFGIIVELTATTTSYIACSFIFGLIGLFFIFQVRFS